MNVTYKNKEFDLTSVVLDRCVSAYDVIDPDSRRAIHETNDLLANLIDKLYEKEVLSIDDVNDVIDADCLVEKEDSEKYKERVLEK